MKRIAANKKPIAIALTLVALLGGFAIAHFSGSTRSTENAYINADVVSVAAQVGGRVIAVHVKDNQYVRRGDALFDIDPEPLAIALIRAQADLALAKQSARQDRAEIVAARAQVAQIEGDLASARISYARDKELVAQHFVSQQSLDDVQTRIQALHASLEPGTRQIDQGAFRTGQDRRARRRVEGAGRHRAGQA